MNKHYRFLGKDSLKINIFFSYLKNNSKNWRKDGIVDEYLEYVDITGET